jgi:nitrogen fixation/metabolism regulation signal transduction histidine kinase
MANTPAPKQKYRRKQYLLDRAFQLKYTIVIALIGAVIASFWGYMFFHASKENSEHVLLSLKVDPELQSLSEKVEEKLTGEDKKIVLMIGGFVLAVILSLGVWGIVVTHRIAGPIFIISRYVDQIAGGRYPDPRPLRQKDELKEFFTKFNGMLSAVKDREKADIIAIDKVIEAGRKALPKLSGEAAAEFSAVLDMLKDIQAKKLEMLKGPPPQGGTPAV